MNESELRAIIKDQSTLAHVIANYYQELKRSGFSEEQALALTISFQQTILKPNKT